MKRLYIESSGIQGKGLFAAEGIRKHEHIGFIKGRRRQKISRNKRDASTIPLWYGITETEWIDPADTDWRYFNHSCEPNCAIVGTKKVIALTPIQQDTEITIDYSMTDGDLNWELKCNCKSKKCRKIIYPIQLLPDSVFKSHLPFIPKYFIKLRNKYLRSARI